MSFRNLKWAGHVQFPGGTDDGLVATLSCEGSEEAGLGDRGGQFRCHVSWIRLTSSEGRVIAVDTPSVPFILTNDTDCGHLQISITAPFSSDGLTKLLIKDGKLAPTKSRVSSSVELFLDFSINLVSHLIFYITVTIYKN